MRQRIGREVVLAGAYLFLAFAFLLPLSLHPFTTVAFVGDGLGTVYFVTETARRLFESPTQLFESGLAFPHAHASLFEAHRLLIALIAAPFLALSGNPILATNAVTLIAYAFNGWSAHHLARRLGIPDPPAFVAGCLFAFNTYALNEEPRVNVVFIGFLPLAFGSLVAYMRDGRRADAWKVALFMLAQAYAENYYLVYGAMVLGFLLAIYLIANTRTSVSRLPGLVLPTLVAGALFAPVLLAYLEMDRQYDYRREPPLSMGLEHYVAPLASNVLYGPLGFKVRGQQLAAHFIGFGTMALSALAVIAAFRKRHRGALDLAGEPSLVRPSVWVPVAFVLALVLILLSVGRQVQWMGMLLAPAPFGFLYDHVGLFQRLRIPERLSLIAMLFIALLAARGLALVPWRKLRLLLCVVLPVEHISPAQAMVTLPVGERIPLVHQFLRTDSARAVAETPIQGEGLIRMESLEMYYALFHRKPITAAYLSFTPPLVGVLRRAVAEFPDTDALDLLRRVGVDTVVLHTGRDGGDGRSHAAESEPARSQLTKVASFPNAVPVITEAGRDLGDAGVDIVYRIEPRPLEASAPVAIGHRLRDPAWAYRSSAGSASALGDGDLGTLWASEDSVRGGEYVEIGFRGSSVLVSGVALPFSRLQSLPSTFIIEGRLVDDTWRQLSAFDAPHRRQLVDSLLASPGTARLSFAFDSPTPLLGVRLRATDGARSFDGWRLAEIEVLSTKAPQASPTRPPS